MMKLKQIFRAAALVGCLTATAWAQYQEGHGGRDDREDGGADRNQEMSTHPKNAAPHGAPTAGTTAALSRIINHGGPVMGGTVKVYLIWYGNWNQTNGSDTPAGQQIVRDFLGALNNSPWYRINTTYTGVTGQILLGQETSDSGSLGTTLSDANIRTLVTNSISSGRLPKDTSGIYIVMTSSNVAESSGFCTQYCGWHTRSTISGSDIKYSFVGNSNRCLSSCAAQTISPNGNAGVDGMISVMAHEIAEAASDPDLNAWYDSRGAENADKCAWTFGSTMAQLPTGAYYNMTLGTRRYLVQRNLDAVTNKCYVALNGAQ